ncbi:MAG TPA: efflux RND transporter periplasmic adaptor subunit, partial [Gemmatimonadota bacterium]|nr:efflux RND transporter periplasmic adaptor subunit [Gemmatimonadota bacterium]
RRGAILLALLTTLILPACKQEEEGRPFQVVTAQRRTLAISAEAAGVIEPVTTVEVKSKASGEILSLPIETGDIVNQGALLVQVEQTDARQTLAQAEADIDVAQARLKIAESQLERAQRMRSQEIISDQDYELAELEHANARAQLVRANSNLEIARERMSETTIRAPITGTIIDKTVEVGQVISSATQVVGGGTLLMTMADLNEVQVRTLVDETDIGRVQPEMPADISVEAYRDRTFSGRVLKIEPQATVTQNVTMFPVIIRIRNEESLLKPGMSAEVTIQVASAQDAITVPTQAVHPSNSAGEVARLALGYDGDTYQRLLSANTPQLAAAGGDEHGTNGQGASNGPMTQAQRDSIRQRFQSGQMTPQEMQQMRASFEAMQRQQEQQRRKGGPTPGVVFVMRNGALTPVPVEVGVTDWENIEVVSGLQEGDSVALLPTASLLREQEELLQRFQRFRGSGVPGMQRQGGTSR